VRIKSQDIRFLFFIYNSYKIIKNQNNNYRVNMILETKEKDILGFIKISKKTFKKLKKI